MRHALFTLALAATACSTDAGKACSTLAAAGVNATVLDKAGQKICNASVMAMAGNTMEALQLMTGATTTDCRYVGLYEKPGTWVIHATGGSLPADLTQTVTVGMDAEGCHVVGQNVTLQVK